MIESLTYEPPPVLEQFDRPWHLRRLVLLLLFNVPLMFFSGRGFFSAIPEGATFAGWLVAVLAFISTILMILFLVSIVIVPLVLWLENWYVTALALPVVLGALCTLIYADAIVFQLFGIHFNGMVWNLMTTEGAKDSVSAGGQTAFSGVLVTGATIGTEVLVSLVGLKYLDRVEAVRRFFTRRAVVAIAVAAFLFILTEKAIYAWGDLNDNEEITRTKSLFPLYQPLTVKRFATRTLGMDINTSKSIDMRTKTKSLNYPRNPITFAADGRRPNILVIGIEGARFDMVQQDVMPNLYEWQIGKLRLANHFSGGNCSRFGIFSLLYGIGGNYWHRFLAERQGPVLVSELKKLEYEFSVLSCTDLNFPEFRKTAFVDVPEKITDQWDCPRRFRDERMTDRFVEFLEEGKRPFFTFMFYDSSHQPYMYPKAYEIFATSMEATEVDYVKIAGNVKKYAPPLKARYKNALYYIDSQLGRVFRALSERGLMEDTLVFITGDHGEEFGDTGKFGHNNTFTRFQAGTFMVAHVPGERSRKITRLTSHTDVVSTIFEYMGVENPREDYTLGTPVTAVEGPDHVFIAGWDEAAVIDDETIVSFGLEIYNASMGVYDLDYNPLPKVRKDQVVEAQSTRLMEVLKEMNRFSK